MRNCYDLATAQKNERENQQVQDTPVNENLILSGKLVVSTDRVHAHVDVKVDDLKPILQKHFVSNVIGSLGASDSYRNLETLFHLGQGDIFSVCVPISFHALHAGHGNREHSARHRWRSGFGRITAIPEMGGFFKRSVAGQRGRRCGRNVRCFWNATNRHQAEGGFVRQVRQGGEWSCGEGGGDGEARVRVQFEREQ